MNACATLGIATRTGVSGDPEPMVFIDGSPEPRLRVADCLAEGPLDTRRVELYVDAETTSADVIRRWLKANVVIALPLTLSDGETRWPVLTEGLLQQTEFLEKSGRREFKFELSGSWKSVLALPLGEVWWINDSGSTTARDNGRINVGAQGNRSAQQQLINGKHVYLIQDGTGLPWTVADALAMISASAGLGLMLSGIPRDVASEQLIQSIDLSKPLIKVLKSILEPYGLVVSREIMRTSGSVVETRAVRPMSRGRPIQVAWANSVDVIGDPLSSSSASPVQASRRWVARASGWVIESTFTLVGGWGPSLEGQPDDDYDKDLSSNFTAYADVYRRWVLNEDGYYSGPPYNRGPAFDLNAFFDVTGIPVQTLAFGDNLTRGPDGTCLDPVIEVSTNSGTDWTVASMSIDILKDRAGVYLDPTSLPGDFLSAAQSGSARVRVTATLTSPVPVEETRWQGNAFTPQLPEMEVDVSDIFFFRRIDAGSIHFTGVKAGTLDADQIDHSEDMFRWLVNQVTRHNESGDRYGGQAKLELAGPLPTLRPGDRLLDVRGPGVAADGQAQALTDRGGTMQSIKHFYAPSDRKGRFTRIDMTF